VGFDSHYNASNQRTRVATQDGHYRLENPARSYDLEKSHFSLVRDTRSG
jgi:hypothetical protein